MGFRSRRVRSRSSNTPVDGAGAGRRSLRSWPSSRSPWRRAWWACSHSGAIPRPSARGPRMPWPVPSRATRPRPERFAISSACWHRPWKRRKCSRMNDSSNLRASYAISRRNCDRTLGSPPRTSLRSAALNVSWQRTSGVGVNTPNHARCSWTPWSFWRGGGAAPLTRMSSRRTRVVSWISGGPPGTQQRYDEALVWLQRAEEVAGRLGPRTAKLAGYPFDRRSATNDRRAVPSSGPRRIAAEVAGVAHPHARAVERACRGRSCDRTPGRARASGSGPRSKRERKDPRRDGEISGR